jgi:hypothetical protein
MVLAELNVRHTRRHMPTRRVALGDAYLPTSGPAYGAVLLGAIVAAHFDQLEEEQQELFPQFLRDARGGLSVPRIALRYRLQTDTHGLDRSRHRIVNEDPDGPGYWVLELDVHGRAAPQVLGAVMAAASLPPSARDSVFRAIETAAGRPGQLPEGFVVHRLYEGVPGARPTAPGTTWRPYGSGEDANPWRGVTAERRWAMEVLGLRAGMDLERDDVQQRFRRLLRLAHPDQGARSAGAAERIAELADARELLLSVIATSSTRTARG